MSSYSIHFLLIDRCNISLTVVGITDLVLTCFLSFSSFTALNLLALGIMLSSVTPDLFCQFFKLSSFEMGEQEFLGGLSDLGLRGVTVPAAGSEGAALERRRGAIEDEYGANTEEEELADATEEP